MFRENRILGKIRAFGKRLGFTREVVLSFNQKSTEFITNCLFFPANPIQVTFPILTDTDKGKIHASIGKQDEQSLLRGPGQGESPLPLFVEKGARGMISSVPASSGQGRGSRQGEALFG